MTFVAPQMVLPVSARRQRRRVSLMRLGVVYNGGLVRRVPRVPICPVAMQVIPPGCTAAFKTDANGCTYRYPVCPPGVPTGDGTPPTPTAVATPVPPGFPTNQIFVATDGSQWVYSTPQGQWINVGTPYNVGVAPSSPVAPGPGVSTAPIPPVSVSVTPAAPAVPPSPYQTIVDFATSSSLVGFAPNWLVGVGLFIGYKLIAAKMNGGRR